MITNPNGASHRFNNETTTKRRRGLWAFGAVVVLTGALATAYLASVGWDWRGALHVTGALTDEAAITAHIKSELAFSRDISAETIAVTTQGGVVRLRGTVPSEQVRELAVDIASNTDGVVRVENQLLVETVDQKEKPTRNERS